MGTLLIISGNSTLVKLPQVQQGKIFGKGQMTQKPLRPGTLQAGTGSHVLSVRVHAG